MNKFKDFFYNKNDIIIVLLILAAAAFVIYDRMEAIMEYPDSAQTKQIQEQAAADQEAAAAENQQAGGEQTATEVQNDQIVIIKVKRNNTLADVSNMLADNGLVASADEFTKYAEDKGKDSKIIDGTYQIKMGTTKEEILNILTHGK